MRYLLLDMICLSLDSKGLEQKTVHNQRCRTAQSLLSYVQVEEARKAAKQAHRNKLGCSTDHPVSCYITACFEIEEFDPQPDKATKYVTLPHTALQCLVEAGHAANFEMFEEFDAFYERYQVEKNGGFAEIRYEACRIAMEVELKVQQRDPGWQNHDFEVLSAVVLSEWNRSWPELPDIDHIIHRLELK